MDEASRHWDARYRNRDYPTEPAQFLLDIEGLMPTSGRALDVAGGAGRNALWLAERGLEVTLVDASSEACRLASQRASASGVPLEVRTVDLAKDPLPSGTWDLIVVIHYLQRDLFPMLIASLAPGGSLVAEIATIRNLERHERPPLPYLVAEGELRELVTGLEVLHYYEGWTGADRHEAQVAGRNHSA